MILTVDKIKFNCSQDKKVNKSSHTRAQGGIEPLGR